MPDTNTPAPAPDWLHRIVTEVEHSAEDLEHGTILVYDAASGALKAINPAKLWQSLDPTLQAALTARLGTAVAAGEHSLADLLKSSHFAPLLQTLGELGLAAVEAWARTITAAEILAALTSLTATTAAAP